PSPQMHWDALSLDNTREFARFAELLPTREGRWAAASAATPSYNMCLISCMNFKSLLRAGPMILFCVTLSTGLIANAASPDATPAASATTTHKVSLNTVKATRLARL